MRRLALILLVACGSQSQKVELVRTVAGDLVFTDVTVVPMDRDTTVPHQTVIVRGDKIVAIAPSATVEISPGSTKIDGAGKWLMPGLADMHVHTWLETDLTMFVAAGVTTVRNMWGSDLTLGWRKAIAAGTQFGPTIVTTSPILDGDPPVWPGSVVLTKPEDVDGVVAGLKGEGYEALKVYARLEKPVYEALVVAAKKHGMTLQGHVPASVGLEGALAAGQRSIEHLDGWFLALAPGEERKPRESVPAMLRRLLPKVDEARIPALAEQMKKAGTYNCATLIVLARMAALDDLPAVEKQVKWLPLVSEQVRTMWNPKNDFRLSKSTPEDFATMRASNEVRAKIVRVLATSGAPMIVGTDTGNPYVVPGESMHDEIELLVAAGASRPRVMRAATADAGAFLGLASAVGVVTVGARADLLLVTVDPLVKPLPLVPEGVVLRGKWHPKADLEAKLAAIARR
ncbi:MAG: amidohydrolase family protein [Myxococcota bacterium]|nr:amidohydrolase family protein [Myxococcota bacterium]